MHNVVPECSHPQPNNLGDADKRSVEEEEWYEWDDDYRAVSSICAGQGLRFAVSNLPQLTSLELLSHELEDAEQQIFRKFHTWRQLRWEHSHITTYLPSIKLDVPCIHSPAC